VKIFICGKKSFGAEVMKALISSGNVITGVAVPPQEKEFDRLQIEAIKRGATNIFNAEGLTASDVPKGTELIIAAHSHHFIQKSVRESVPFGAIGFHPSLLPVHRGRDSIKWAVSMRERVTGGTVYRLDEKVDGGPIILQRHILIHPNDTASTLWGRLLPMGAEMLCDAVDLLETGCAGEVPQDESFATWEPSFDRSIRLYRPELIMLEGYK
jgi:methionyl-tRNA formyltransferase